MYKSLLWFTHGRLFCTFKFQFILQFIRRGGALTRPLPATIDLIAFISSVALASADGGTFLSLNKKVPKEVSLGEALSC